ncbi:hypothetical protein M0R45_015604 [Rubus argutus]|uniref:Uncharacterized protein n=1 Tax=Rubus argutus TaxID=59490 RepID=A0AAW1XS44_RUBAR
MQRNGRRWWWLRTDATWLSGLTAELEAGVAMARSGGAADVIDAERRPARVTFGAWQQRRRLGSAAAGADALVWAHGREAFWWSDAVWAELGLS